MWSSAIWNGLGFLFYQLDLTDIQSDGRTTNNRRSEKLTLVKLNLNCYIYMEIKTCSSLYLKVIAPFYTFILMKSFFFYKSHIVCLTCITEYYYLMFILAGHMIHHVYKVTEIGIYTILNFDLRQTFLKNFSQSSFLHDIWYSQNRCFICIL